MGPSLRRSRLLAVSLTVPVHTWSVRNALSGGCELVVTPVATTVLPTISLVGISSGVALKSLHDMKHGPLSGTVRTPLSPIGSHGGPVT